jgi:hypothetical protein
MDLQHCGEWAIAGRLVKARQALLGAGALVDDVLDHEFVSGIPGGALLGSKMNPSRCGVVRLGACQLTGPAAGCRGTDEA